MLEDLGDESTKSLLFRFTCQKNQDVEDFLKSKSIAFEKTHNARTSLILNEEGDILAYFTLSFKELVLDCELVSKNKIKKMDGFSKSSDKIRAFLLGQIGKNSSIENNPLTLETILIDVYSAISEARKIIGGRIIVLECEDNERLISLYQEQGFSTLKTTDTSDDLITMYTYVTEV